MTAVIRADLPISLETRQPPQAFRREILQQRAVRSSKPWYLGLSSPGIQSVPLPPHDVRGQRGGCHGRTSNPWDIASRAAHARFADSMEVSDPIRRAQI